MSELTTYLSDLHRRGGSDLILKVGRPPLMRLHGRLMPSEHAVQSEELLRRNLEPIMSEFHWDKLAAEREVDLSFEIEGTARFRVNVFYQRGFLGTVIRVIPLETPTIDALNLPPVLKDVAAAPHGILLVTGPTGSGKSTTMAAIVEHINATRHAHIITIEDPVEFVYQDKKATVTQRGIGEDTLDASRALRAALRQNPDVILAGEMRDRETMELALHAAGTGHLVISTLHTNGAKESINRITDAFPPENKGGLLRLLAVSLRGVISQRLLRRADGTGRVAAFEVMVNSPTIRQLIEQGRIEDMQKAIANSSTYYRMQSFNQSLAELAKKRLITQEAALEASSSPGDLKLLLRGMSKGSTGALQTDLADTQPPPPRPPAKPEPEPERGRPAEGKPRRGFRRPPRPSRRLMNKAGQPGSKRPRINRGFDFS